MQRIFWGLVLIGILFLVVYSGRIPSCLLIGTVGVLIIDEVECNFFGRKRLSFDNILAKLLFMCPYIFLLYFFPVNWFTGNSEYMGNRFLLANSLLYLALFCTILYLGYLFFVPTERKLHLVFRDRFAWVTGVLVFFQLAPLVLMILGIERWVVYLLPLLLVTYLTDTGAWFFGKNFGKHKLCPSISPKKTVEGLIGGVFVSMLGTSLFWVFVVEKNMMMGDHSYRNLVLALVFAALALLSHLGDLFESKIKRQFFLKDSSSLIPGHGGVYDRVDSLIFIAPVYVFLITKYLAQ